MQETRVRSLGWEDPLKKEPTPVFLPGKSHEERSLAASARGVTKGGTRLSTHTLHSLSYKAGRGQGGSFKAQFFDS